MANTGSPGRVFKGKKGILSNNLFKIMFEKQIVDGGYLYNCLSSQIFQKNLQRQMKGGIQKHLGHGTIARQKIPLPPLKEQQRIAAILDKADAIRRKRQQTIALADEFLRSVFLELFGDPVTNPKGWEVKPLGELVINLDGKRVPIKSSDRRGMQGEFPYYGASGIIDYVNNYLFDSPNLLIGEDGANLLSRSTPIAFIVTGRYWVNNHAHVLAEKGDVSLGYLKSSLNLRSLESYISGSAQPKLNQKNLNQIPIQVPPKYLITRFGEAVLRTQKVRELMQEEGSFPMLESLNKKAFQGNI